jgi:acetate kinase
LNGGSSSLKFALYEFGAKAGDEELLAEGAVERLGLAGARLWAQRLRRAKPVEHTGPFPDHRAAVGAIFDVLEGLGLPSPAAVGHRLVHGGPAHAAPERVDARLLDRLRELIPLAPLHIPSEIAVIEAVAARFADLPQAVCFDTAFHRSMPELAQRLPLSGDLWDKGVRRYGSTACPTSTFSTRWGWRESAG